MELIMSQWRDRLLSDVEALSQLSLLLPSSRETDALVEVIGKMFDEEVEEWEQQSRRITE